MRMCTCMYLMPRFSTACACFTLRFAHLSPQVTPQSLLSREALGNITWSCGLVVDGQTTCAGELMQAFISSPFVDCACAPAEGVNRQMQGALNGGALCNLWSFYSSTNIRPLSCATHV